MALFATLIFLMLGAAVLLAVSRRVGAPYPALLALAGAGIAFIPAIPNVDIDPRMALALFLAPALLDAAYDTSPRDLKRLWVPLLSLVVGAVVVTTVGIAWLAHAMQGMPWAAGVALGAIVAPPDAAATSAILSQVELPRRSSFIIKGESLLNDATALLIYGGAVALISSQAESTPLQLSVAVPGGVLFGLAIGWAYTRIASVFAGTHASILLQFANTFAVWLIADWLHLSSVLAVVSYAMVVARVMPGRHSARDRVQSYAVWAAVVFALNVAAFLFMGFQTRAVLSALHGEALRGALLFAAAALGVVIAARMLTILVYHQVAVRVYRRWKPRWLPPPASGRAAFILSWCGTRGIVTLAASFALPADFPFRAQIVLAAVFIVMGTLVLQGCTLKPLIRLLGVEESDREFVEELGSARARMLQAGLESADNENPAVSAALKRQFGEAKEVATSHPDPQAATRYDAALARAVATQRRFLHDSRGRGELADDVFQRLQEELDWLELSALPARDLEVLET